MFFAGGNPIGDSRRSLGLGLTLCQAIIHAHHGEITLKTIRRMAASFPLHYHLVR